MTQEREYIEWDPYEVLQLDRVGTVLSDIT